MTTNLILPAHVVRAEALRKAQDQVLPAPLGKRGSFFRPHYSPTSSGASGGDWKPADTPSFQLLRTIAARSVIDALIIDARRRQVKKIGRRAIVPGKDVGLRVVHRRYDDPDYPPTPEIQERCRAVEAVLERVNPQIHQKRMKDVLAMWTEDELVIDRKVMVVARDRMKRVIRYHYVDGATVLPRISVLYPWMLQYKIMDQDKAAMALSYKWNVDLTNAAYVQEIDGQVTAAWKEDEISVDIANPVGEIDHMLYGRSSLERSLDLTRAFVNAWKYNQNLFDVRYPEAILVLIGNYGPEELEDFRNQLTAGDAANNQRLPLFTQPGNPTGQQNPMMEVQKLRDTPREMMFPELLRMVISLKCAAYGMHPSTINFSPDGGGQAPIVGSQDQDESMANADEDGLGSVLDGFCDWLGDVVVDSWDPDLKLIVDGLDQQGEMQRIEVLNQRPWLSLNEVRAKDDAKPAEVKPQTDDDKDLAHAANLAADLPRDPAYIQLMTLIIQGGQQAQAMQQQAAQGGGGQPGEDFGQEQPEDAAGSDEDWWKQQAKQQQMTAKVAQGGKPPSAPAQPAPQAATPPSTTAPNAG